MQQSDITVQRLGDRAFSLRWNEPTTALYLASMARAISRLSIPWLQETVAAYRTITFHIIDTAASVERASLQLLRLLDLLEEQQLPHPRHTNIPVVYGGEYGPDLAECARRSGMTERQFAERHSEAAYTVAMMGFAPGFPYLSGLNEALAQPRHDTPRMKVLAGSVGVAGGQTGIYPVTSPGGWQIIGRTAIPLFRPEEDEPFLLAQGDIVRFIPVIEADFDGLDLALAGGREKTIVTGAGSGYSPMLQVQKPGLLTTIQDCGRKGWQAYGVSVGGAMDEVSLRKANLLIGNDEDAAALEITLLGGSYSVLEDVLLAICGADLSATVDGTAIPMNRPVWLSKGSTLSFGPAQSGCRAYLAIAGGINVPFVLGSRSTDPRARIGGGCGRALAAGDTIASLPPGEWTDSLKTSLSRKAAESNERWIAANWSVDGWIDGASYIARQSRKPRVFTLRLLAGSEWDAFTSESRELLFEELYRVEASSDRMGIRLSGEGLVRESRHELESHGVTPGTIQVPPSGQPIILAAGCQPTGGYPKIAHVISADLPSLAQAVPGDLLAFELTDESTAEQALKEREREIAILKAGMLARSRQWARGGIER
ncbi:5-oxoprolinase subunit PxpB [Cohnella luojiensis]|uniref:5-oxoprolinase subunit PxpB n=1 Tax=Cohnella luojiensis TaxID=652876 RepID=A0A4Y8M1E4_9BACL|nr:5-oxoprolinase subunit PxpB [Cohnella luojiensis]TFE28112.1 5-oxoprolinase subunit PxpB [Cohnella luojiensis]